MDMEIRDSVGSSDKFEDPRWRIAELEAHLALTEHRLAEEVERRRSIEARYGFHGEIFEAMKRFADSLREVRRGTEGMLFQPGFATSAWHDFLGREMAYLAFDGVATTSLELLRETFRDIESAMMLANLKEFLERAKVAHLALKFEVYKVFMGLSPKTAEDFAHGGRCFLAEQCAGCRRGKCKCIFHHPRRGDMQRMYACFHDAAIAAVDCFRQGASCNGMDEIAKMEKASLDLLAWLSESVDGWVVKEHT